MRFQKIKINFSHRGENYEVEIDREQCFFSPEDSEWWMWHVVEELGLPRRVFGFFGAVDNLSQPLTDNLACYEYEIGSQYRDADRKAKIANLEVVETTEYAPEVAVCPICSGLDIEMMEDDGRYYCPTCRSWFKAEPL